MIVKRVEDLLVYQRADELWDAVTAILKAPGFRQNLRLHSQIADAADSVISNIAEGFEQPTDRAFARYVYLAKGSAAEVRTRIRASWKRGYISVEECQKPVDLATEVTRMCTGLAKYLLRCNRKDRGLGKSTVGKSAVGPDGLTTDDSD